MPYVYRVLLFSMVTNLLVLAPSWYMLEVYERVVNSQNLLTLFMLTLLVIGCYLVLELLEWVRSMVMHEGSEVFDRRLRERLFNTMFNARLRSIPVGNAAQALGDMRAIRDFLPSQAFLSILDSPLALLVLSLIFLIHPFLGWFALGGAVVQFIIGFFNEERIREPLMAANRNAMGAQMYAGGVLRNAQVIESMGMLGLLRERWLKLQRDFLDEQAAASDSAGTNAAFSKLAQMLLSSLILGLGCWLTLKGELPASGMIVASILGGRVLSPLVQIIANWRNISNVRESYTRLGNMLASFPAPEPAMPLPAPKGQLSVEAAVASAPGSQIPILKGISFRVMPGDSVAVVGPSGSGKTTLARLLVGVWPPASGKVRLDGSDVHGWDKEELGPHVGYLPQSLELFEGSVAENIARFGVLDDERVQDACRMVGLDALIDSLPDGYATQIGSEGAYLSGGQRQRVALARAVYGMPMFVVLDEPNSNLDEDGDAALLDTLKALKANGTTVIVMTHRVNLLSAIGHMLVLVDGQLRHFGPRDEVLAALQPKPPAATASGPGNGAVAVKGGAPV